MAAIKGRKHRTGVTTLRVNAHVTPVVKAKAEAAAEALGISMSAYLEELIRQDTLDERGRPTWWAQSAPRDQEELPLKTA